MVDRSLAGGLTVEGTFTPDQLYAGEADIVTTQGVVNALRSRRTCRSIKSSPASAASLVAYNKEGAVARKSRMAFLPHAIPDTAADQDTPVIIGGVLNFDALVADAATYDVLREAFASSNSNIVIQKLF
jgi:hypothetical protein